MSNADNIKIRQTWINEETEKYSKELDEDLDTTFLYLSSSFLLDCQPEEIEEEDIIDGAQDKQIDLIHIEEDPSRARADITIIQAKNTDGFSSNIAIQIRNGLDWIFERPKSELQYLQNPRFKSKIEEIRETRTEFGAANIDVHVFHITNGDSSAISQEYQQEKTILEEKYKNVGFNSFAFNQIGAHELINCLNEIQKQKRKVDLKIPIQYDINRASLMEFSQGDTKSFVCTILGEELAKAASTTPKDSIFDMNVRPYYGKAGQVNKDIWDSATSEESSRFWFLNNGITMICDSYDFNRDPDNPLLEVKNAQIVNGCQTTVTLREAYYQNKLTKNTKVLLRVYSTDNPNLVEKITLSTNNQNKITDRDLRANDPVQRDIEQIMFNQYGYFYERKNKQFKNIKGPDRRKIIPSPKAAQSYLAIVRAKPANARGYLSSIWSDFYGEIFQNASVPDLILSYKIYQICHSEARASSKREDMPQIEKDCRVYGLFHIARTIGKTLVKDQWGHKNIEYIKKLSEECETGDILKDNYKIALQLIIELREQSEKIQATPAMYFKNTNSQKELNKRLSSL